MSQLVMRKILTKLGYRVTMTSNGVEAVEAFQQGAPRWLLLVRACTLPLKLCAALCGCLSLLALS